MAVRLSRKKAPSADSNPAQMGPQWSCCRSAGAEATTVGEGSRMGTAAGTG